MIDLLELMDKRETPRAIKFMTEVSPSRLWYVAKTNRPDWLEWVYDGVAGDYREMDRRDVVRKWGISQDLMTSILEATGTSPKNGEKRVRKDVGEIYGFNRLMNRMLMTMPVSDEA